MSQLVPISEVFGPVIQGEGAMAGRPTIFVRTGGCDFHCSWCDTLYAVDARTYSRDWRKSKPLYILDQVVALAGDTRPWVTISGGNPAMWKLTELVELLQNFGFPVAIETQGSMLPEWLRFCNAVTFSPKPPSSGHIQPLAPLFDWLDRFGAGANASLKVVVATPGDMHFVEEVRTRRAAGALTGSIPMFVQPMNPYVGPEGEAAVDRLELLERYRLLCADVLGRGWTDVLCLPQLHVLMDGGGRGR